jgi:hypothetical protein
MIGKLGNAFTLGNSIHFDVGGQGFECIFECGGNLISIDLDKITKFRIIAWQLGINFHRLDNRVDHLSHISTVGILRLSSRKISVVPNFHLPLQVYSYHGGTHEKETVFRVQHLVREKGYF